MRVAPLSQREQGNSERFTLRTMRESADCSVVRCVACDIASAAPMSAATAGGLGGVAFLSVLLQQFDGDALPETDGGADHAIGLHIGQFIRPLRDSAARHVERASEIRVRVSENPCGLVFGHGGA